MSKMKVYQDKVEAQPIRVDTVLTPELPEVEQVNEIAQEAGNESIGWAEGMATEAPEDSIGWVEGMAGEAPHDSIGWAEGMTSEAPEDSKGWAEGY
jgi:hypothetical protein